MKIKQTGILIIILSLVLVVLLFSQINKYNEGKDSSEFFYNYMSNENYYSHNVNSGSSNMPSSLTDEGMITIEWINNDKILLKYQYGYEYKSNACMETAKIIEKEIELLGYEDIGGHSNSYENNNKK